MLWVYALVAAIIPAMALASPVAGAGQIKELVDFVTKTCTKRGAKDKIPHVMESFDKFEICIKGVTKDLERIVYPEVTRKGDEHLNGLIKQYCVLAPQMVDCSKSLLEFVAVCGDKDEKDEVESTRHLVDQLVSYVCHKDGERIVSLLTGGGTQCVEENYAEFKICTAFVGDQIASDDDEDNSEENDVCEVFDHTSNCILDTVSDCSPSTIKISTGLSEHLRKAMNCSGSASDNVYKQWLQARTALKKN